MHFFWNQHQAHEPGRHHYTQTVSLPGTKAHCLHTQIIIDYRHVPHALPQQAAEGPFQALAEIIGADHRRSSLGERGLLDVLAMQVNGDSPTMAGTTGDF